MLVGECPQKAEEGEDLVQTPGLCGQARDHRGALKTQSRVRTKQKSGSGSSGPPEWAFCRAKPKSTGDSIKDAEPELSLDPYSDPKSIFLSCFKRPQPDNFFPVLFRLFHSVKKCTSLAIHFSAYSCVNLTFPTPAQQFEINCCPTRHRPITLPSHCTAHHCLKL